VCWSQACAGRHSMQGPQLEDKGEAVKGDVGRAHPSGVGCVAAVSSCLVAALLLAYEVGRSGQTVSGSRMMAHREAAGGRPWRCLCGASRVLRSGALQVRLRYCGTVAVVMRCPAHCKPIRGPADPGQLHSTL
jgi:hypothetical protein